MTGVQTCALPISDIMVKMLRPIDGIGREFKGVLKDYSDGKVTVQGVVVLGLLGMLCILASSCFSKPKETDTQQTNHSSEDSVLAASAYCTELEEQLEQTLSTIQGVGTCDVMITLRSTSIYQYAKDESRSDSSDRVEQKQDYVLIGNGTSEHALVQSIRYPEIQGVVIVCDGGENAVVKEQVYQVAAATLQIKNNQIYVAKRR